jgi:hypothetical protein
VGHTSLVSKKWNEYSKDEKVITKNPKLPLSKLNKNSSLGLLVAAIGFLV